MKLPNLLPLAISAALAFTPALHAYKQKKIVVHQIGRTTMSEAVSRATNKTFLADTALRPKAILKQLPKPSQSRSFQIQSNRSLAGSLVFGGYPVVGPDSSFSGFDGLDSTDSGQAVGFVDEPPDQGMSTNGYQVAEAVNLAIQVFSEKGKPLVPPTSLYAFFGVPVAANPDGSFNELSDPRIFYDWESGHWFVTILEYKVTAAGALTGGSEVLVAVSDSRDAVRGSYTLNSVDVSDTGYGSCPCLGDQPLLGLNRDGVYLSTNEFSTSTGYFQTALVVAVNKRDLIEGTSTPIAAGFDGLNLGGGESFSVQPALPAPGTWTGENRGTEFLTGTLDFYGSGDDRVGVFAITNTETLKDNVPNLNFQQTIVRTEQYSSPVPVVQKRGRYPLGMSLGQPEERLDAGDDRMEQLYYAAGKLYCGFNTTLLDPKGKIGPRTGAVWLAIQPKADFNSLSANVWRQGYIGIPDGSVLYPSFAVDKWGNGAIGFSLSGPNYFPSTGYVHFERGVIWPHVRLAGIGQAPEDGFSGYPQFGGGGIARWGDYGAAMVGPNGVIWLASEYIPNPYSRPRTKYTNWGTFISRIQ